jgi:hypothetical protein
LEKFSAPMSRAASLARLEEAPAAFFKFAALARASAHREAVPVEASFAAKITGKQAA